jgi:hypothetical protein
LIQLSSVVEHVLAVRLFLHRCDDSGSVFLVIVSDPLRKLEVEFLRVSGYVIHPFLHDVTLLDTEKRILLLIDRLYTRLAECTLKLSMQPNDPNATETVVDTYIASETLAIFHTSIEREDMSSTGRSTARQTSRIAQRLEERIGLPPEDASG